MPVNAVLVGLSAPHSQGWLQTLKHSPAVTRVVACDDQLDAPEAAHTFRDLSLLLEAGRPDFALVSLPNDEAPGAAEVLLEAGIPCIVEKPARRRGREIAF